jgi:hypothetical protein
VYQLIKSNRNSRRIINTRSSLNKGYTQTSKLVLGSIFAAFAAIFQSAGIFVGFGYVISFLATLPIVLSTMISLRIGLMSYFTTILLLIMIQPSELIIFSFTTGLLGVCLGMAFKWWKSWIVISLFSGIGLTLGMIVVLYFIQFPILGPTVSNVFDFKVTFFIYLFSLAYSLIWMVLYKKISGLILKGNK